MGIFDDMTALLGRGMDAADKKTQEVRIQSEINRIDASKEKALAELGRAVLTKEGGQPAFASTYAEQVKVIGDLEAQAEALRLQLEGLRSRDNLVGGVAMQAANAAVSGHSCPSCGTPVALESMYCPSCGDNLEVLKRQFRRCPNCNTYHTADASFCERCGTKTVELEIAQKHPIEQPTLAAAEVPTCPQCGHPLKEGASFCGNCGTQV